MCAFGKANVVHLAVNTLLDLRERIDMIACIRAACSSMIGNDDISDDDPYMKAGLLLVLLVVVAMQDTAHLAQYYKHIWMHLDSEEAADGLSKALGPRWDKKTLEVAGWYRDISRQW